MISFLSPNLYPCFSMNKILRIAFVIALSWLICLTPVLAEEREPLVETGSLPRLEFARLRSRVLPGIVIGGHYEGWLKILQSRYTANGELDTQFEDSVRDLIEEELSQAGFDVLRSHSSSVFEEAIPDDLDPGRFLIGGTIIQARLNSYSAWWNAVTKDERKIRWEVFDRDRAKVIYRQTATGSAQAEGINNPAATYESIRTSLRTLLNTPNFVELMQTPSPSMLPVSYEIDAVKSPHQPLSIGQIAGRSVPSIVRIRTSIGRGSGFLLDPSGLIVTNEHVVESAYSVKVDFYDGATRVGRVLKRDPNLDAALVKLDGGAIELPGLPICQTNAVRVGESVVAIGNPLSLSNSVTQGIVSGFRGGNGRNLIQTDTAINPGNSGGPLLNQQGAVIGIVTEKVSSKGIEGLGFALPIGEVLQRLKVKINAPMNEQIDACGNPI
jgi:serine protease Do